MPSIIQVLRRINSTAGAPATAGAVEGMIAVNAPGAAGSGPDFTLFFFDGTAWRSMTGGIKSGTTAPAGPANGDAWMDTSAAPPLLKVYDGTRWKSIGSLPQRGTTAPANPTQGEVWVDTTGGSGNALLKVYDGAAWQTVNAAVTTQTVNLTAQTGAAHVGAAYTAAGSPALTGTIIVATWNGSAYLLTNRASPGLGTSWTSLGGSVDYATAAQIVGGTVQDRAIAPDQLRAATLAAPTATPANDANYFVRLNGAGKIDEGFLTIEALQFRATLDVTAAMPAAPTQGWNTGDFAVVASSGVPHASWAAMLIGEGPTVKQGDLLIFDGTNLHVLDQEIDLSAYLPLAGGTMADGAGIVFDTTTAQGGAGAQSQTIINGAGGKVDNVVLDMGTY